MNPREFCQERGLESTLFLTYSFDAVFFERVVLPDLLLGDSRDIIVVADRSSLFESSQRWSGQVRELGRRYLLADVAVGGAFHPKVFLRTGRDSGLVWLGSGNLTSGGWGGNREVACAWKVGAGLEDNGAWIRPLLGNILALTPDPLTRESVTRMRDLPWLAEVSPLAATQSVLIGGITQTLATQLSARWARRRFRELSILTGSTDEDGAMLKWAHETFGVRRVRLVSPVGGCQLDPRSVRRLPLELTVAESAGKPLHAKFYWFEGQGRPAAVVGSANCSGAAWLQTASRHGNVEAVAVFDDPDPAAFGSVLRAITEADHVRLSQRPGTGTRPSAQPGWHQELRALRYSSTARELVATLSQAVPVDAKVFMAFDAGEVELEPLDGSAETTQWCTCVEYLPSCEPVPFGRARIVLGASIVETPGRWVDKVDDLRTLGLLSRFRGVLEQLRNPLAVTNENSLLRDIHLVAQALLGGADAFPDPSAVLHPHRNQAERKVEAAPLDPASFVKSLADVSTLARSAGDHELGQRFSLYGVIEALFDLGRSSTTVAEGDVREQGEDQTGKDRGDQGTRERHSPSVSPSHAPGLSPAAIERLARQMDAFLDQFCGAKFFTSCAATQLVQAAAFPLAVAALTRPPGAIVDPEEVSHSELTPLWQTWCARWVKRVFDALFTLRVINSYPCGLLAGVRERFEEARALDVFDRVVGDGTLWVALLSALGSVQWTGPEGQIEKALALRAVFNSRPLLAGGGPGRLAFLVQRILTPGAQQTLLQKAPAISEVLSLLERQLNLVYAHLIEHQPLQHLKHSPGDLIWSPAAGWGVIQEEAAITAHGVVTVYFHLRAEPVRAKAAGFFVNVQKAALSDEAIARHLEKVTRLME